MAKRFARFLKLYHLLLTRTGGYGFIRQNAVRVLASIAAILVLFYLFDTFVIDIDSATAWLTKMLSTPGLLSLFFFSEITLGFIAPEILIVWAREAAQPIWMLVLLAFLSYCSGIISYFIGKYWATRKIVNDKLILKHADTLKQLHRFGGLLIILAAMTPLPYPIVCQLCGLNKYPFKMFAFLTLVRFLRFGIYGAVLYNLF
ncbi:MAG: VTT domain-containing protein [Flavobacteriales bacterium]|jgi:membrane protein YqaA with SNARE-associated domain|tara:strand:- start:525 stop:1130 length:606 start_codon:yes stop_codon:yes gene_type:complete